MSRCRIISGTFGGRFITAPSVPSTRPTSDICKQALFNVLLHRFGVNFNRITVFDLFAGSGSLGIEAISCGCQNVLFIEANAKAAACIRGNLRLLNVEQFAKVLQRKAEGIPDAVFLDFAAQFDEVLVFMDPPYAEKQLLRDQIERFLRIFHKQKLLIAAESDEELQLDGILPSHTLTHGKATFSIYGR